MYGSVDVWRAVRDPPAARSQMASNILVAGCFPEKRVTRQTLLCDQLLGAPSRIWLWPPMLFLRVKRSELWMHCGGHLPANAMAAVETVQSGQWWLDIPLEDTQYSGSWPADSEHRVNNYAACLDSDHGQQIQSNWEHVEHALVIPGRASFSCVEIDWLRSSWTVLWHVTGAELHS